MKTLGKILGSAARIELLRALNLQGKPIGLRQLARIARIQPRSADLAIRGLMEEGLVCSKESSAQNYYGLNREHADSSILSAIFQAETKQRISNRSETLSARAIQILPFIEEATSMLQHARKRQI